MIVVMYGKVLQGHIQNHTKALQTIQERLQKYGIQVQPHTIKPIQG